MKPNNLHFSYKRGQCPFIDWLCNSNKLIILSDGSEDPELTSTINSVSVIEEMLEYPAQDLLVLKSGYNMSHYAFRKIMEELGEISFGHKQKNKNSDVVYYLESKRAVYCSPCIIVPWQELKEVLEEFNLAYLIPTIR